MILRVGTSMYDFMAFIFHLFVHSVIFDILLVFFNVYDSNRTLNHFVE